MLTGCICFSSPALFFPGDLNDLFRVFYIYVFLSYLILLRFGRNFRTYKRLPTENLLLSQWHLSLVLQSARISLSLYSSAVFKMLKKNLEKMRSTASLCDLSVYKNQVLVKNFNHILSLISYLNFLFLNLVFLV